MARGVLIGILVGWLVAGPLAVVAVIDDWSVLAFYAVSTLGLVVGLAAMFRLESVRERMR